MTSDLKGKACDLRWMCFLQGKRGAGSDGDDNIKENSFQKMKEKIAPSQEGTSVLLFSFVYF